ncbi:MAG: hypothetical protein E7516_08285 [Ruminococcaceae bacterium]|nr:hypothetical protein [Oscillospiraceae bacterium]
MLGYVKAFKPEMKIKDYELYRGIYCSLCRALGRLYSPLAQLFLSYDFAFAAVLRLAAGDENCAFSPKRCPYNPAKKCMICGSKKELDFCAHAVIITVFYKIKDNLHDGGVKSKILAALLYPLVSLMHKKAAKLAPEVEEIISKSMALQTETEKKKDVCLDEAAHPSADALGRIMALGFESEKGEILYRLGYMIGRTVYIIDAADDLEADIKNGSFNPFKEEYGDIKNSAVREAFVMRVREIFNLTQSSALDALDTLEKKRFEDILENIVLDGLEASVSKVLGKYEVI